MNKLDEFFKEKLTSHSLVPSGEAWQKVETALSKKNKPAVWLRWAAVFLLAGLLLSLFLIQKEKEVMPLAEKASVPQSSPKSESPKPIQPLVSELAPAKRSRQQKRVDNVVTDQPVSQQPIVTKKVTGESESTAQITEPQMPVPVNEQPPAVRASHGIVLTYTLDPVETLVGENAEESEVASVDTKSNSLKRVVTFAKNVKNGDTHLSGVRIMKEDLFALDLKKKTSTSTKKH